MNTITQEDVGALVAEKLDAVHRRCTFSGLSRTAAVIADTDLKSWRTRKIRKANFALRGSSLDPPIPVEHPDKALERALRNLVKLKKQSSDACFECISCDEASCTVVSFLQGSPHFAQLQAQLAALFEAIADGRTNAHVYPHSRARPTIMFWPAI